jgi:hypothetical protein
MATILQSNIPPLFVLSNMSNNQEKMTIELLQKLITNPVTNYNQKLFSKLPKFT